jgi:hypothetical protein
MKSINKRPTIALLVIEITIPKIWEDNSETRERVKPRVRENLKKLEQYASNMPWPKGVQIEPVQGIFGGVPPG